MAITAAAAISLRVVSVILGWTYFVAWSISFYPQVILNYRRKYVGGLSIDFTTLNVLGHSSYAIYASAFFFDHAVRDEYRKRHDGHNPSVQPNDVAFACHAATLALITFIQTFWYPRAQGQLLSLFNRYIVSIVSILAVINAVRVFGGQEHVIDFLYFLSYFKLYVSIAKYVPQAWGNFRRKSTVGWSIGNILLDFTGGILSLIQLFIDAVRENDWTSITGNPVKFGLAFLSIIFDVIFIAQHFLLYTDHSDDIVPNKSSEGDSYLPVREGARIDVERGVSPARAVNDSQAQSTERSPLL